MTPLVPIALLVLAVVLLGVAAVADGEGHTREAVALALCGLTAFVVMLATVDRVEWDTGAPRPLPSYHPVNCPDLAWLDGQWKCIPYEEQG